MKLLVATPCFGGQVFEHYMRSIISLIHSGYAHNVQIDVLAQAGESLIPRARNDILAMFWAGDWTDLLWIDADLGFQPEAAWRLLESPYELCAAPYALKRLDVNAVASTGDPESGVRTVINAPKGKPTKAGFVEVFDAGTGFMLMRRSAVEKLLAAYPELKYTAESDGQVRWAIFDTMLDGDRYLSEDYAMCRRWQKIGGRVMVDVDGPPLVHRGSYDYSAAVKF